MARWDLIVVTTTLLSTGALAQPRPLTLALSCSRAAALVGSRGAIVLSTGPTTYDRYVRSPAFCLPTEFARPAWVPTVDTPQCLIGYTCVNQPPNIGGLVHPDQTYRVN